MKTRYLPLCLAWLLAVPSARAQDATPAPKPPAVSLTYPFTTGVSSFSSSFDTSVAATPIYGYGGEPLNFIVTVQAPLGTHLRVYADVLQQAGAIAVPWLRHTPVSEEQDFGDRTSLTVSCTLPTLRSVQRKTRVSIVLRTEPAQTDFPGGLVVSGFLYPREEPGAWKKQFDALLARAGVKRVAVFGGWKNTAVFLRQQKIAFDDLGGDWPAEPDAHTLYLGSGITKAGDDAALLIPCAFGETPGVRLILFEPWETEVLPPGVYQTTGKAGGGVWKVTLPDLFVGASKNKPRGLETLTTILQQALLPRQSAPGNDPEPTPTP